MQKKNREEDVELFSPLLDEPYMDMKETCAEKEARAREKAL